MSELRIGVLGCGRIARGVHLRVLRHAPAARVAHVADPDPEARAAAARLTRAEATADPFEALARPDIDAFVICAPTGAHAALGVAAAGTGKPVYLEKPIALTVGDARRVADAFAASRALCAVGFNHRFNPLHARARTLLRAGAIGRVRSVHTAFCEPAPQDGLPAWKAVRASGGGALLDLGSHQVDLVRWLLDDEVATAQAVLRSELSEEDVAELRLELAGGASAHGFFSFRHGRCDWLRLTGERGTLSIDRYAARLELARTRADIGAVSRSVWPRPWAPPVWRLRRALRPAWEPSYRIALRAFVAACRGAEVALPSADDGLRSLEALAQAEAAAVAEVA